MHNPTPILENETQTPLGFLDTNMSSNLGQTTGPYTNNKKRELAECWTLLSRWHIE